MRHGKKFNHLGRTASHRKAVLKNLSKALIEHKRIKTTLAKAKALRRHIEPLVTKAKTDTIHNRRVVFSYLQDKEAVQELFGSISAQIGSRPGGYLRVIKLGFRKSDGAEMALIEFVDFNEEYSASSTSGEESTGGRRRRRRRGGSNKSNESTTATSGVDDDDVDEELED